MDTSDLAKRMKNYEHVTRSYLVRRMPVIIRIDGKAFHSFTKDFERPFDKILIKTMQETMKYLCENIQGCVLGYTQSDEITLVLVDYKKLNSCAWFDNNIQKMCSISASMATMAFNFYFGKTVFDSFNANDVPQSKYWSNTAPDNDDFGTLKMAMFDARVFNTPKEEVCNNLIWRQLDATRNSIQMVGQANFPHKELQNKSCNSIQDMLMTQKNINWNDLDTYLKRGSCCIRNERVVKRIKNSPFEEVRLDNINKKPFNWIVDEDIPIFTQNRGYIENRIYIEEE